MPAASFEPGLRPRRRSRVLGLLLLAVAAHARAGAIGSDLRIEAHANLLLAADAAQPPPSLPAQGNASQQATLSAIVGGRSSAASVTAQLAASGTLPQGGTLLDLGDGVGITADMSGLCDGAPAQTDGLFGEYDFDLRNRSATDRYRVSLKIEFSNSVAAAGPATAPDGAYSIGLITFAEDGGERFYSNLTSDTVLGDKIDVTPTGTLGQPLRDGGVRTLDVEVPPGGAIHLAGRQELRGAATTSGASYHGTLRAFVSVIAAVNMTQPSAVVAADAAAAPARDASPSAFFLYGMAICVALALLGVIWFTRRRK